MAEGKLIPHHGEALVLRTWPFHEADLLVSLFTREQGRVKGVARHAMKSRKRFGGALEPATHVRAHYTERPRQDLVRMDSLEILWSPLSAPVDYMRTAGLQLVVEVLEEALPELAPEDNVFRLALAVLRTMEQDSVLLSVTYFAVWISRLMGWWPELGHCTVCGLSLQDGTVWWSPHGDGVTCVDDRRSGSVAISAAAVQQMLQMFRHTVREVTGAPTSEAVVAQSLAFSVGLLERHLERRIRSARAFQRG